MADPFSVQNPHEDRITQILQKRAQPVELSSHQMNLASEAAVSYALGGRDRGYQDIINAIKAPQMEQQDRELQSAQGLYQMFEDKLARGDKQAQAFYDRVKMFTGDDPQGIASALEYVHNLPDDIDPTNAYQMTTALARWSKETGYKPIDIRMKEAQIKASESLATQRQSGGGGGGSSVFSQTMKMIDSDPELSQLSTMEKLRLAQNKVGTNLMLSPTGEVSEMSGAPEALGKLKAGEKSGEAFGKLQGAKIFDLPRLQTVTAQAVNAIDNTIASPGLKNVTGIMSKVPIIPGGERARAEALLNQVGGRVFLAAYDTLKGGGQITELEGKKAEQAIAAIGNAQSHEDVVLGLKDLRRAILDNLESSTRQATQTPEQILSTPYEAIIDNIGIVDMTDDDILRALE